MEIGKFSFGIGDRFGRQGKAQLRALIKAKDSGIDIVPVWNKSHREHGIVGTLPGDVREEAEEAVSALNRTGQYLVDADHINMDNVEGYIESSDFFTIDVADHILKPPDAGSISEFIARNRKYIGELTIPGFIRSVRVTEDILGSIADRYLFAVQEAGRIYRFISVRKGTGNMVAEVSMDEVMEAQSPVELFFILSALAAEKIPLQTIAPKFSGRFNKGVDYQGDIIKFEQEFEEDLLVLDFAVREFGLPGNLKLSIHSGSDKFRLYPIIGKLIRKYDRGIHVKTAGTTWLEEVTGLAAAGGGGLELARKIYLQAYERKEELCGPYAAVIDIDADRLPLPEEVSGWNGERYANALRHIPEHEDYNPHFRQLIHVAYKVAAGMGDAYYNALDRYSEVIGANVEENIFDRHLKRLFEI